MTVLVCIHIESVHVVEVTRGKGPRLEYKKMLEDLETRITELVNVPPPQSMGEAAAEMFNQFMPTLTRALSQKK